jgi:hypothetical protein
MADQREKDKKMGRTMLLLAVAVLALSACGALNDPCALDLGARPASSR